MEGMAPIRIPAPGTETGSPSLTGGLKPQPVNDERRYSDERAEIIWEEPQRLS